ncbi:MAG: hypothetical protein WCN27_06350 [Alphaproteobacteria bacterium]
MDMNLFKNKIYTDARCLLFHAKDGKSYFFHQGNIQEREAVTEALTILTSLFLFISKYQQNLEIRGIGGLMTSALESEINLS